MFDSTEWDNKLRSINNSQATGRANSIVVAAPHSNFGEFRGVLSSNLNDERDYTSGFCLDLGPPPSNKMDWINVEGLGFTIAADLCDQTYEFGQLRVFTVVISKIDKTVSLRIDGKPTGQRPYSPSPISLDEWTLGARYVSDGPGEKPVLNAFEGDIAEVLVFNKALDQQVSFASKSNYPRSTLNLQNCFLDACSRKFVGSTRKGSEPCCGANACTWFRGTRASN